MCDFSCTPGCACKQGLLLDENTDECVPESKCRKKCLKNSFFNSCGSGCEKSCQTRAHPKFCTFGCVQKCSCESGFILNEESGECIQEENCPYDPKVDSPICLHNEEWLECSSAESQACESNCDNPSKSFSCKKICIPG